MLEAIRGHYKNGKFELYEKPHIRESEVVITFLNSENDKCVDLQARGISKDEAEDLRGRLKTFETDWNAEGMDLYDKI